MKCPKCKKEHIKFEGYAGRCEKCAHIEYIDPFVLGRFTPIDTGRWFDRMDSNIREGRFF